MGNPQNLRAFLPYYLATIGLIIGLATIFAPISENEKTAGIGLAGAAIAGAAGLAEPTNKNQ